MATLLSYKGNVVGSQATQVLSMPTITSDNLGQIVQYIGASTQSYTKGFFYQSVSDGESTPTYSWENIRVQEAGAETIVDTEGVPSSNIKNVIYRTTDSTIGETTYYAGNETEAETEQLAKYSDIQIIQVETIPSAGASHVGKIYQYIGATNLSYTNGYFYKCVSDGAASPSYSWEEAQVQKIEDITPHWTGTQAEYNAAASGIEDGTIVNITDDYQEGVEVVDVIEEDNEGVPTSAAVYDALQEVGGNEIPTSWTKYLLDFHGLTTSTYNGYTFDEISDSVGTFSSTNLKNIFIPLFDPNNINKRFILGIGNFDGMYLGGSSGILINGIVGLPQSNTFACDEDFVPLKWEDTPVWTFRYTSHKINIVYQNGRSDNYKRMYNLQLYKNGSNYELIYVYNEEETPQDMPNIALYIEN